jgi:hypothetical protein
LRRFLLDNEADLGSQVDDIKTEEAPGGYHLPLTLSAAPTDQADGVQQHESPPALLGRVLGISYSHQRAEEMRNATQAHPVYLTIDEALAHVGADNVDNFLDDLKELDAGIKYLDVLNTNACTTGAPLSFEQLQRMTPALRNSILTVVKEMTAIGFESRRHLLLPVEWIETLEQISGLILGHPERE